LDRGRHIPFFAFWIIHRYESRFAAHRKPDIVTRQFGVDGVTELVDGLPLFLGIGFSDAGASQIRATDISCEKLTSHLSTAPVTGDADPGFRRAGEGQVAFACE